MTGEPFAVVLSALPLSANFWLVALYRRSMKSCVSGGTSEVLPLTADV